MKRLELLKRLRRQGWEMIREGSRHSLWRNNRGDRRSAKGLQERIHLATEMILVMWCQWRFKIDPPLGKDITVKFSNRISNVVPIKQRFA